MFNYYFYVIGKYQICKLLSAPDLSQAEIGNLHQNVRGYIPIGHSWKLSIRRQAVGYSTVSRFYCVQLLNFMMLYRVSDFSWALAAKICRWASPCPRFTHSQRSFWVVIWRRQSHHGWRGPDISVWCTMPIRTCRFWSSVSANRSRKIYLLFIVFLCLFHVVVAILKILCRVNE